MATKDETPARPEAVTPPQMAMPPGPGGGTMSLGDFLGTLGDYARGTLKYVFMPGVVGAERQQRYALEQQRLANEGALNVARERGNTADPQQQAIIELLRAYMPQAGAGAAPAGGMGGGVAPTSAPGTTAFTPVALPEGRAAVINVQRPSTFLEQLLNPGGIAWQGKPSTVAGPTAGRFTTEEEVPGNKAALELAGAAYHGTGDAAATAAANALPSATPAPGGGRLPAGMKVRVGPQGASLELGGESEGEAARNAASMEWTQRLTAKTQGVTDPALRMKAAQEALVEMGHDNPAGLVALGLMDDFVKLSGVDAAAAMATTTARNQAEIGTPTTPETRAAKAAQEKGLKPGTPEYQTFVNKEITTLAGEMTGARAQARAQNLKPMPASEIANGRSINGMSDLTMEVGERFTAAKKAIGPVAGVTKKMRDLTSTNPGAYVAFQAANSALNAFAAFANGGKQLTNTELQQIEREVPQFANEGFRTWVAKYEGWVRRIYRRLKINLRIANSQRYMGADEMYGEPMRQMERAFPEALGAARVKRATGTLPAPAQAPAASSDPDLDALLKQYNH